MFEINYNYAFIFRNEADTDNLISTFTSHSTIDGIKLELMAPRKLDGPIEGIDTPDRNTIYFVEYMRSMDPYTYQVIRSAEINVTASGRPDLTAAEFVRQHAENGSMQGMANDLFKVALGKLQ